MENHLFFVVLKSLPHEAWMKMTKIHTDNWGRNVCPMRATWISIVFLVW